MLPLVGSIGAAALSVVGSIGRTAAADDATLADDSDRNVH